MEQTVEVDSGFGVTIPQEMLDRLNLAPGSKVSLELLDGRIRITKAADQPRQEE
jgi:AbrB family looped-hinge helix DNA binding protein